MGTATCKLKLLTISNLIWALDNDMAFGGRIYFTLLPETLLLSVFSYFFIVLFF